VSSGALVSAYFEGCRERVGAWFERVDAFDVCVRRSMLYRTAQFLESGIGAGGLEFDGAVGAVRDVAGEA
jgi:hypothetical protein